MERPWSGVLVFRFAPPGRGLCVAGRGGGWAWLESFEHGLSLEPLAIFHGGVAGVKGSGGNVVGNAAFGGDDGALTDGEMAGGANLSREDAAIANSAGTGQADLAAEHSIGSDLGGVTDQDQVIELGAAADARFANG